MKNNTTRLFGVWLRLSTLAAFLALTPAHAAIDLNSDGIGDIFALKYGTGSIIPSVDTDGDGKTNGDESVAGTNPLDGKSNLAVSAVTIDGEGVRVAWLTLAGKRYQVESSPSLSPATWLADGAPVEGTGDSVNRVFPPGGAAKYYRVVVQDKDTDHDGVTDWEEITAGYNPNSAQSFAGTGTNDLTAITASLQASGNNISAVATDAEASEPASGTALDTGTFVISRSGNFNPLTINYTVSGTAVAGGDYLTLSGSVTLPLFASSATITITPLADATVESPESVSVTVSAGAGYTSGATLATVLISDYATASGNGLRARYWNNLNTSVPMFANGATGSTNLVPVLDRIEPQVNFSYPDPTTPGAGVNSDYYTVRFSGEILPEFSQIYTFTSVYDRGCRLYVNGALIFSNFSNGAVAGTSSGPIELEANKRVPIVFEYMARSGTASALLRWASANRPVEIIPQNRLFSSAPPQILSVLDVVLIQGSPLYNYQIAASGEPTSYNATNRPPGWNINTATGVLSGVPTVAGTWQIPISASNANGSGTAILNLQVIATGSAVTRDVWTGIPGTAVSAIPLATAPTSSANISLLDVPQSAPNQDDYGTRIRGYITAPSSGIYKFWLTGSDSAELWIGDDDEVVNSFKRAAVTVPTAYREWTSVNAGKSPLLKLQAAKRYYIEVRQKAGVGASDHVSVGWLKPGDPGSGNPSAVTVPTEPVPSYALSPFVPAVPVGGESTLFVSNLTAEAGVTTGGFGAGSLRLSADETQAIVSLSYANLTSLLKASGGKQIRTDAHAGHPAGELLFSMEDADRQPDGSWVWNLQPTGSFGTSAAIASAIKGGLTYLTLNTVNHPNGEIRGNLRFQPASQTFTPPAAQTWTDPGSAGNPESHLNRDGASRFLVQATFGTSPNDISASNPNSVLNLGYEGWIDYQATLPATLHFPVVFANRNQTDPQNSSYNGNLLFSAWWKNSVTAPDQLRQRVGFALSEILVTSEDGPLDDRADAVSDYYDVLLTHAFGNFRDLLESVTLHPAMGRYLDMLRNDKPDKTTGRIPNENYAREIKQLFSIGLNRLHPDGSLILNSKGELIPTYDQDAIIGFSHVFTGWDYFYTGGFRTSFGAGANWIDPMREVPVRHFTGQKLLLNNVVIPGLPTVGGVPLDPYASHGATQYNDPAYQALPAQELDAAHDAIFNHPNCGPFICRQLIQRLVSGTPSRGYLYRVVQAFNDNGSGVRGDMKAVIKAILLDYEARSATAAGLQGFGKQREPVARITGVARGFPSPSAIAGTYTQTGSLITVNTAPANHLYTNGSPVPLEFSEATSGTAGSPYDATYTIANVTAQGFTVRVKSYQGGVTYEQNGAMTRLTVADGNGFFPGPDETIHVEYLDGTPAPPASGTDIVDYRSGDEFNIYLGVPGAKRASYSQTAGGSNLVVTSNAHGYLVGANIQISFVTGTGVSGVFAVTAVTTNTFTVLAADTLARSGSALVVDAAQALPLVTGTANVTRLSAGGEFANRSGTVSVTYSDWEMNETVNDLNQTPLRSPTVFNFFLPDYQFPGILGNAGLITPEFELTSETSVIRQANFIYSGLYSTALSQTGLESFKGGGRDIIVDLRPWMGIGPGGLPWVHNSNLSALVEELSTLLTGGQLPAAAKTIISNHTATVAYSRPIASLSNAGPSPVVVTINSHGLSTGATVTISGVTGSSFTPSINGTFTVTVTGTNTFTIPVVRNSGGAALNVGASSVSPLPPQLRDRVRAVVHLIVTSPDFTIQK